MKKRLLIFFLINISMSTISGQSIFEKISSKTWLEEDGFSGTTIVFVKTDNNQLKVFRQINGSGVPVISTEVLDVDVKQDTIYLLRPQKNEQNNSSEQIIYTYNDKQKLLRNGKPLGEIFNQPLIYLFTENNQLVGERINANEITRYELDRNRIYVDEKHFIIDPKNK